MSTRLAATAALVAALLAGCTHLPQRPGDDAQLQAVATRYFRWAVAHHAEVTALAPRIVDVAGTDRFRLDRATEAAFSQRFLASGLFAPAFAAAVERYYARQAARIDAIPQAEFATMARDGRGPQMEAEDNDVLFCAQEYDVTEKFASGVRVVAWSVTGDTAQMTVETPAHWTVDFHLVRSGSAASWLIAGFCWYR